MGKAEISEALSLILFVHLAVAADADKALTATGLSRTHHRILFLVALRPGVTVGEIVTLLRVTAQAIQAPLRTLIESGLIEQQSSERDKRRRHLVLSERGQTFLTALADAQYARIAKALDDAGAGPVQGFLSIMQAMMDEHDRQWLYPAEEPTDEMTRLKELVRPSQPAPATKNARSRRPH
ncbi:MarR family winged helix-turn-helix transcriptional regulator [Sphingobium amiense]|uniref:MarR family winged helix-turn-helix transcriptional regulator n=1 Tax=Sphingobium amiense TaxID=135719 RepID=UPI0013C2DA17|nr:MarR family transcriptional regulator [Sphingobium amiense]